MKFPFVIYASTDSLLEKIDAWYNNPNILSTAKVSKHIACGYSLFTHCSFDSNKYKLDY